MDMAEPVRGTATRRQVLRGASALAASAGLALAGDVVPAFGAAPAQSAGRWGRIANRMHHGRRPLSGLFFAGPPNPASLPLYTRHPRDADRLDWTDPSDIVFALGQVASVGLNTLKLSYFGHQGETDQWAPAWLFSRQRWPGDGPGTYTETEQVARGWQVLRTAERLGLLVAPLIEVSPAFPFWADFPTNLDGLVARAGWLLRHFGAASNFLRLYDRDGRPRHALFLIETIHVGPVDPLDFAAGFDRAAQRLADEFGHRVGWVIDPTPLPAYGSHDGPDPAALRTAASVLAVNPFNITSQGLGPPKPQDQITEAERLAYARGVMTRWSQSGLPFLAPVTPGYDAHIVFPDTGIYGFNPGWRRQQRRLALEFASGGLTVDTFNAYTEGSAIPPTVEDGDAHRRWLRDIVAALRHR
jgi:hypothetical protein